MLRKRLSSRVTSRVPTGFGLGARAFRRVTPGGRSRARLLRVGYSTVAWRSLGGKDELRSSEATWMTAKRAAATSRRRQLRRRASGVPVGGPGARGGFSSFVSLERKASSTRRRSSREERHLGTRHMSSKDRRVLAPRVGGCCASNLTSKKPSVAEGSSASTCSRKMRHAVPCAEARVQPEEAFTRSAVQ